MRLRPLPCLFLAAALMGAEPSELDTRTEEEIQERYMADRSEAAAAYRQERARLLPGLPAAYHAAAGVGCDAARAALIAGRLLEARQTARATLRDHPYAERAAELQHILLRTYAIAANEIDATRLHLIDLWERHHEYEGVRMAMEEVLLAVETSQRLGMAIDLDASSPAEVVTVTNGYLAVSGPLKLLYFLRDHGDRCSIAPRATLGIARCLLARGTFDRDALQEARLAYDGFLTTYPDHPLIFTALLEQAVAYLVAYRGPRYDVGVLIFAAGIVDQAEIYTRNQPERIALVKRYRGIIRRCHQERDLFTAEWYHRREQSARARYYYQQVVDREPDSPAGRSAQAALAELPPATDRTLGAPVPAPAPGPAAGG
jgi:hypothetical protein